MTQFDSVNRLMISGVSSIAFSSDVLAWQTERIPGVFFGTPLDLAGTDAGFLESIAFINSANDLPPTAATFVTAVRFLAKDAVIFCESCECSDIVRLKSYS